MATLSRADVQRLLHANPRLAEQVPELSKYLSPTRSKWRNIRTRVGDVVCDSKKEARRYEELLLEARAGNIKRLRFHQPVYKLIVNGVLICQYEPDFTYYRKGKYVGEDAKGKPTTEYKIKRKLMLACHGIEILET